MKRRGFMGGLAALMAGGRQAAGMASEAVKEGISMGGFAPTGPSILGNVLSNDSAMVEPMSPEEYIRSQKRHYLLNLRRLRHMRKERPDWYVSRMRDDLRYHGPLDSDLESHRAMSPAIKRLIQRDRQLERMFDQHEEYQRRDLGELLWEHGPGKKLQDLLDSLDPDDMMPF